VRLLGVGLIALLASAPAAFAEEGPINLLANQVVQQTASASPGGSVEVEGDDVDVAEVPAELKRQTVDYETKELPGTIVVDTEHTHLYFVLGGGKAVRYGIGVGRDGFTWAGREKVTKMAEWPDWHPPAEMIERQPYLPRFVAPETRSAPAPCTSARPSTASTGPTSQAQSASSSHPAAFA
jgi:lipoprotein-anchoring transpeptidase ErfK/SrfK